MPDDSPTRLRNELLAGATSKPAQVADQQYFAQLRNQIMGRLEAGKSASRQPRSPRFSSDEAKS